MGIQDDLSKAKLKTRKALLKLESSVDDLNFIEHNARYAKENILELVEKLGKKTPDSGSDFIKNFNDKDASTRVYLVIGASLIASIAVISTIVSLIKRKNNSLD